MSTETSLRILHVNQLRKVECIDQEHGPLNRVITYIDGFNLYYGLREKGWKRYYWLDPVLLSKALLKPGQRLVKCRYFTARIRSNDHGHQDVDRQRIWLEAIETLSEIECEFGLYIVNKRKCRHCERTWEEPKEKKTDVNIATRLLLDAFDDLFDTAIVISADSDLSPPIRAIRDRFPDKRVIVAFPPKRHSNELCKAANASIHIGRDKFRKAQLPDQVLSKDGYILRRPEDWK